MPSPCCAGAADTTAADAAAGTAAAADTAAAAGTAAQGPDVGDVVAMLLQHSGEAAEGSGFVGLPERMEQLRKAAESL